MLKKIIAGVCFWSVALIAQATTVSYTGATKSVGNCIPFGCPDTYGPHAGFIYKDIAAFTLNPGDIIAFDTGGIQNDKELHFDLSLAATAVNGGKIADSSGFTLVSSLGSGFYGDSVVGNYDIAFVVNTTFTFAGGGLITDFLNTNGAVSDTTTEQNLVSSSDSPYNVARYYKATSAGTSTGSSGLSPIGVFQIVTVPHNVPEPSALFLLGMGIASMALARRYARR